MNKIARDIIILHVYRKPQSSDAWFLRYGVWHTNFFVILDHFFPFNPLKTQKIKSLKNEKTIWRCHHFTHKYQKSQSNNACFLRYGVWQTYFFPFRPFSALLPRYWPWELKFRKNVKQAWRFYPFTHVYHKWRSHDLMVPEI